MITFLSTLPLFPSRIPMLILTLSPFKALVSTGTTVLSTLSHWRKGNSFTPECFLQGSHLDMWKPPPGFCATPQDFHIYIVLPHPQAAVSSRMLFWSWSGSKTTPITPILQSPKLRRTRQEQNCLCLRGSWTIHLSSLPYPAPQSLHWKSRQPFGMNCITLGCQQTVLSPTFYNKIMYQLF